MFAFKLLLYFIKMIYHVRYFTAFPFFNFQLTYKNQNDVYEWAIKRCSVHVYIVPRFHGVKHVYP